MLKNRLEDDEVLFNFGYCSYIERVIVIVLPSRSNDNNITYANNESGFFL